MSSKRINQFGKGQFTAGALSVAAIAALLSACAPAKRLPFVDNQVSQSTANLTISRDIDMVRLEGVLQTPEQANKVVMAASRVFDASMVIDNIAIDNTVERAEWIETLLATAEHMKDVDDFSLVAANGQLVLGGSVDSADAAESLSDLASDLAGVDLAVSTNLSYTPSPLEEGALIAEVSESKPGAVLEGALFVSDSAVKMPEAESVMIPSADTFNLAGDEVDGVLIPSVETFDVAGDEAESVMIPTAEMVTVTADEVEGALAPSVDTVMLTGAEINDVMVPETPVVASDTLSGVTDGAGQPVTLFGQKPTMAATGDDLTGIEIESVEAVDPLEPAIDTIDNVIVVEQPAVASPETAVPEIAAQEIAAIEPAIAPVAAALQSVPVTVEVAVNEPVYEPKMDLDSDADGVSDSIDQCTTRPGYPVDARGCQVLERYLDNIGFTADAAEITPGSEPELDEIAMLMQNHPAAKIAVITHALDATDEKNAEARQRAFLVTSYLEDRGVERGRVYSFALAPAVGVGDKVLIKEID